MRRSFVATCREHGIPNVVETTFDPRAPRTPDEDALWIRHQKYAFSALKECLRESSAVELLRKYSRDDTNYGNARQVYFDLVAAMTTGAAGKAVQKEIEEQIRNLRLDRSWTKTMEAFVTHVSHLMEDHQNVADSALFNDEWYIDKIEESLRSNHEFRSFLTNFDTQRRAIREMMPAGTVVPARTLQSFLTTIRDHAISLDMNNKQKKEAQARRAINQAHQDSSHRGGGGRGGGDHGGNPRNNPRAHGNPRNNPRNRNNPNPQLRKIRNFFIESLVL